MKKPRSDEPDYDAIDRLVLSLPRPPKKHIIYSETKLRAHGLTGPWKRGLGVRVFPRNESGHADRWVVAFVHKGRPRLYTQGDLHTWPARKLWPAFDAIRAQLEQGIDPQAVKQIERRMPNIDQLCDRFIAEHIPKMKGRSSKSFHTLAINRIRKAFGHLKPTEMTPELGQKFHDDIAAHGALGNNRGNKWKKKGDPVPAMARNTITTLRSLMSRAVEWGVIDKHPFVGPDGRLLLKIPKTKERQFLLKPDQLDRLVTGLVRYATETRSFQMNTLTWLHARRSDHPGKGQDCKRRIQNSRICLLALITSKREWAVMSMKWSDITIVDEHTAYWRVPTEAENKRGGTIRLPDAAVWIINLVKQDQELERHINYKRGPRTEFEYLFPSWHRVSKYRHQTRIHVWWKNFLKEVGIPHVMRFHDLRHNALSIGSSLGIIDRQLMTISGHATIQMLGRYAHPSDAAHHDAVNRIGDAVLPIRHRGPKIACAKQPTGTAITEGNTGDELAGLRQQIADLQAENARTRLEAIQAIAEARSTRVRRRKAT